MRYSSYGLGTSVRDPAGKLDGYASLFLATFYLWEGVPDVDHPIALGMLSLIRIQVRWLPPLQLKQGLVSYGWWDQKGARRSIKLMNGER